ncbi:MAG TPA: ABC transporter permease, partial [Alphaproteobacteria bacterium]
GAILGSPLPLGQSLLLVWPQITGLVAIAILLFAVAYTLFQRQEIRA